jgi:hypothetical protein
MFVDGKINRLGLQKRQRRVCEMSIYQSKFLEAGCRARVNEISRGAIQRPAARPAKIVAYLICRGPRQTTGEQGWLTRQ